MLQSEVINKLARECCLAIGEFDHFKIIRTYIQMALSIGIEHFTEDMEEIVVLDRNGTEAGRFKSITKAAKELGLHRQNISAILAGQQQTAGGLMFIRTKDYELVKRDNSEKSKIQIIPLK